jgi:Uma2 family endonuclease
MTVIERPPIEAQCLREQIEALKPGDVFSIDRPITVDEFCEYVRDEGSAELVNGVIYVMSPPTDRHEALCVWLTKVIGQYAEVRGLGEVRASKSGVLINSTSLREPDLLFFRSERLSEMTARGIHGAPDLVVEIVDSAKARREAVEKQAQYEAIGVAELWVIDLPRQEVRQFALQGDAFTRIASETDGEIASQTLEGFRLKTAWLFGAPTFPSSLGVVQALLARD